jgi:hypothetical protein
MDYVFWRRKRGKVKFTRESPLKINNRNARNAFECVDTIGTIDKPKQFYSPVNSLTKDIVILKTLIFVKT